MRSLLIDSHELIWILFEPERINKKTKDFILKADIVYVSQASIWELALKYNKGKLAYDPESLLEGVDALGAKLLHVKADHILKLKDIATSHKDPFDHMLLAQANVENLHLVTADTRLIELGLNYVFDSRD